MRIGFVGLGTMGLPMARNLVRAGLPLTVWNRTPERSAELVAMGANAAADIDELCARADTIVLSLLDEHSVDAVLGRGTPAFRGRIMGRTWVQLGTTAPSYSLALAHDIVEAGGDYVEAPVSGSSVPAAQGRLVGMLAGRAEAVDRVAPLLAPLCRDRFICGAVPNALRMKLAVNHYLIATVVALAETVQAARANGIDLALLSKILDAGPMASEVSRGKLAKLVSGDHVAQAAIRDVRTIAQLVADQARSAGIDAPLIAHCAALYQRAAECGFGDLDMSAVVDRMADGA